MKLRRLTLQGFKSFADRTELHFHDGITAIVGPNGCGKSNISDAIRWVLGEQRASAIRGSKMEEAIFQGTTQRRPLARAEVALEFDNSEQRLAMPHKDVEIRRVVFREGGSDYLLNRQSTRLRDILDMFRDTGLGANSYTVIEQGMVDSILSDRAEERRHMFEEAAGIGRYKDRRKSAQRRLEGAENDLSRLEDLVSEVTTKVRSLARQRTKAEKYQELRRRRLDLEVSVARAELERVRRTLDETARVLEDLTRDEPAARAALSTAEAELEQRRIESTEAGRERNLVAERHQEISRMIAERERELAVAAERRAHAERRIVQIGTERDELHVRIATLEAEVEEVRHERGGQAGVVESLGQRVLEVQERQSVLRQEVTEVRRADEEARSRENDLTRQLARMEADAAGAEARAHDAQERLEQLDDEESEILAHLAQLEEQRDLFAEQARQLEERIEELSAQREGYEQNIAGLREAELEAKRALSAAEDHANRLGSQVAALETIEREYQGFAPAVAAALNDRGNIDGLVGPVAEFLNLPKDRAAAVEGALGSLLQALVVRDRDAAAQVRQWVAAHSTNEFGMGSGSVSGLGIGKGAAVPAPAHEHDPAPAPAFVQGTVALIPRDALPKLEALIEVLEFAGTPPSEPMLIGRHERLERLRREAEHAAEERDARLAARDGIADRIHDADEALRELRSLIQSTDLELKRANADEATRAGQRGRADKAREELERRRADLRALIERARGDAQTARTSRTDLERGLGEHRVQWQQATESLAEREAAWEEVRDEEAELRVAHARAEGTLTALDRRIAQAKQDLHNATHRLDQLNLEEQEHVSSLDMLAGVSTGAGDRLQELFAQRDEVSVELRRLDEALAAAADAAMSLEAQVRTLRRSTEERSELRHRLEIQRTEADAADRRVRERLEAEWAKPYEQLVEEATPLDMDIDVMKGEFNAVTADIERLGPINMLAMDEYAEESTRLEFLTTQRDDLVKARDDLQQAIREINKTAKDLFNETFNAIRENFQTTFQTLFEGGECDIRLEDSEDPLESPIDISASPRGKRTQRIHLLSGGERALTALALLFAIYLVKPSPFCVLDEVDAPLDEANIGRFIGMLQTFKERTQFVVITHHPRTMEAADWLYGVTMEEPGISSIVGVKLDDVLEGVSGNGAAV
ncbi:MAG TPA: AAA family ATPase [Longimicrobiales bacterium]|nr:AAA family ATPase [Longimicrobiales bacterium]